MCAGPAARRPVVLVAEPETELRSTIASALRDQFPAVQINAAADGDEAWTAVRGGAVDLLLAAVAMPRTDGMQLLRRVRERQETARTYVVLMAGVARPDELCAAMEHGADDCVLKPVRWNELVARVSAGLRRLPTIHRQAEREVELERLHTRQTEFLSMVSHEIRTPLSAILSAANVLMRYGSARPDSVERFAKVIHQEGRRLTRLINNHLDLAKIEAGQVEWVFAPTEVDGLVRDVEESFSALVGERNIGLEVEHWHEPVLAELDRDKVIQVLVNLLSNSIKHSPDGAAVRLRYRPRPGGGVRLEVEDEGTGIPAGREEAIFERFQQLGVGDRRQGSGLGLTISRQIVENHGGRIWAEPGRASGALFVVELPASAAARGRDGSI
ncbi:MAG TPA: hybrid sensor histidine kinase/response regulator [Thermoanaerobaculaceae bacterium]|nr:hybrid sensor histidine kinase/response regulator [Thermoanaerobaculaceae bacterium]